MLYSYYDRTIIRLLLSPRLADKKWILGNQNKLPQPHNVPVEQIPSKPWNLYICSWNVFFFAALHRCIACFFRFNVDWCLILWGNNDMVIMTCFSCSLLIRGPALAPVHLAVFHWLCLFMLIIINHMHLRPWFGKINILCRIIHWKPSMFLWVRGYGVKLTPKKKWILLNCIVGIVKHGPSIKNAGGSSSLSVSRCPTQWHVRLCHVTCIPRWADLWSKHTNSYTSECSGGAV